MSVKKTEFQVLTGECDQCQGLILGQLGWGVENFLQEPINTKDF